MKRILGLVPNVFFLGLVSLFNDFSAQMIFAVMPGFLLSLGAGPIFIGFIEGFADALASILKIGAGWFSDRVKRRKSVSVGGYALSLVTRPALIGVGSPWQAFILRALDRVGKGVREAPRDALLAESVDRKEMGRSFGFHRAMDALGGILGPIGALAILPFIGGDYQMLFAVASVIGLLAIFSFIPVREVAKKEGPTQGKISLSFGAFQSDFKRYLLSIFCFGIGVFPISLMLLRTEASPYSFSIPLFYLIYSLTFTLSAIPFGKMSDVIGEKKMLALGFVVAIGAYIILALDGSFGFLVAGFALFGIYSGMTDGVARSFAAKVVHPDLLASGQGLLGAALGISSLLAGLVGGGIWAFFGPEAAFIYGAAAMGIGLLLFLKLSGIRKLGV